MFGSLQRSCLARLVFRHVIGRLFELSILSGKVRNHLNRYTLSRAALCGLWESLICAVGAITFTCLGGYWTSLIYNVETLVYFFISKCRLISMAAHMHPNQADFRRHSCEVLRLSSYLSFGFSIFMWVIGVHS